MLVAFSQDQGLPEVGTVSTRDQMDDGTPICLAVTIDRRDGSATFDFEGARTCLPCLLALAASRGQAPSSLPASWL